MLPSDSPSFRLKLRRAEQHLEDIGKDIERWRDDSLETVVEEPDPEESGYFLAWVAPPAMDLSMLSLRVGDCLQCLRSMLDHLAFELASTFTTPMTNQIEKDSQFPILSDIDRNGSFGIGPDKWRSSQKHICGMDPDAQTVIEGLQPYKRGHTYDTDPLWRLGVLNNIDKHRALHFTTRVISGATMPVAGPNLPRSQWPRNVSIGTSDNRSFAIEIKGDIAAEGRTLVARWPMFPIDPSKKMHMGFRPILDVAFGPETPLVGDAPVFNVLGDIHKHIVSDVLPPLVDFLVE